MIILAAILHGRPADCAVLIGHPPKFSGVGMLATRKFLLPTSPWRSMLGAGNSLRAHSLICPSCHHPSCSRSRRRSIRDHAATVTGLRPWRCPQCGLRFYGWSVPIRYVSYAHCRRCGNFDLQRVSRGFAQGRLRLLWSALGLPVYRCAPCRNRFFSCLPRFPGLTTRPEARGAEE
jgi:hypothetical protein